MSQPPSNLLPVTGSLEELFPELLFPSNLPPWEDVREEDRSAVEALLRSEVGQEPAANCSSSIRQEASSKASLPPTVHRGKCISTLKSMLPPPKKRSYIRRTASPSTLTKMTAPALEPAAGSRKRPFPQTSSCRPSSSETPLPAPPPPPSPPKVRETESASRSPSNPTSTRMRQTLSSVTVTRSIPASPIIKSRTPLGYIMDLFDTCISPNLTSPHSSSSSTSNTSSHIMYRQMYRRLVSDLAQIRLTTYSSLIDPDELFCVATDVFQGLGLLPPF